MIQGTKTNEQNYRAIMLDSSSSLKDFCLDRRSYYKKYILRESVEEKDTQAATMGRVVETLLLEPEEFDNRFHISTCLSAPTGLMLDFVEALYSATKSATTEDGDIIKTFEELAKEAYANSGFKISFDAVIKKFQGSDAEVYYNEIRVIRSKGLTVITTNDVTNAEKIAEELKNNFVTRDIINLVNSDNYTIYNQYQVEKYTIFGHSFKSMMDKVVVDKANKVIEIYDLKCIWAVENFYREYYLYRRAYIQAFLYYIAMIHEVKNKPEFEGYFVKPPMFIVCDSINYYNPLIYKLTEKDLQDALEGFEYKNTYYQGVRELIENLNWAMDNNIWNISRENYENKGIVNLNS